MKIIFTADWHLRLSQKNVPVDWAIKRYNEFFKQIYEYEKEVDLHIIGGDVFDRMPTLAELNLYFSFIKGIGIRTLIYSGNHCATKKNRSFFTDLDDVTHSLNPLVTIIDTIYEEDTFSILPYEELHVKSSFDHLNKIKPLFTHVRGNIPPHVKSEVDLDLFKPFPIVFAGDLHSHSNSQLNIVYPGSPMTTSFHRSPVETGCIIIEGNYEWSFARFKLPQLIRLTVKNAKEMVPTDYDHTIYELEGDLAELSGVKSSDLLDKKIVKRKTDAALYLDKGMSIQEELVEYLTYILEISENKVRDIINTFNNEYDRA